MAWTASTSRVSSPYQPDGPHLAAWVKSAASVCVNWPAPKAPSPLLIAYFFVSVRIVGAAYASMMATVTPVPSSVVLPS